MSQRQKNLNESESVDTVVEIVEVNGFVQACPFEPLDTENKESHQIEKLRKIFDKESASPSPLEKMAFSRAT